MLVKMLRNWVSHTLLMGMLNGMATLQNSFAVSYKYKHKTTIWPSNYTFWHLSQRNKNLYSYKNLPKCS